MRTVDSILHTFDEWVKNKEVIAPHQWVEAAQYLNVLISDEHDILFELQKKVAELKLGFLEEDNKANVSRAKLKVEATDEYLQMNKQKARIDKIIEFIRIAKLQARLKNDELLT